MSTAPNKNSNNRNRKRDLISQARIAELHKKVLDLEFVLNKILEGQIAVYETVKTQQQNIDVTLAGLKKVLKKTNIEDIEKNIITN